VHGNDNLRSRAAIFLDDSIKGLGANEGLVAEDDQGCVAVGVDGR
jgi:hypothetical protein